MDYTSSPEGQYELERIQSDAIELERQHSDFRMELESVINKCSMENGSNTPDAILAVYLTQALQAFDLAVRCRDQWYGVSLRPGGSR